MKAYITVGISASGKTTWANQMIADSKSEIVDINRDKVREMIFIKKNDRPFSWREWIQIKMKLNSVKEIGKLLPKNVFSVPNLTMNFSSNS
jgi:adenosyl cobinamide kinase/adenosyl cobinamide phosphate guanylyltransferase